MAKILFLLIWFNSGDERVTDTHLLMEVPSYLPAREQRARLVTGLFAGLMAGGHRSKGQEVPTFHLNQVITLLHGI